MAEKPSKRYNVPSAVTDSVRRREREKRAREDAERSTDSDIPESDKMALKRMIDDDEEEGFKKGGAVRKFAEGGLVRGSVRGGGVAIRGVGKGKVY
jgi:hypothetical protein